MTRLSVRDGLLWLAFPLAWTGVTLVRGALDGWYPYPFLDPANGGYGQVAVIAVAITAGLPRRLRDHPGARQPRGLTGRPGGLRARGW